MIICLLPTGRPLQSERLSWPLPGNLIVMCTSARILSEGDSRLTCMICAALQIAMREYGGRNKSLTSCRLLKNQYSSAPLASSGVSGRVSEETTSSASLSRENFKARADEKGDDGRPCFRGSERPNGSWRDKQRAFVRYDTGVIRSNSE